MKQLNHHIEKALVQTNKDDVKENVRKAVPKDIIKAVTVDISKDIKKAVTKDVPVNWS